MVNKKYIFWIVLALVLIGAGTAYWWSQKPSDTEEKDTDKTPPAPTPTNNNTSSGPDPIWSDCLSKDNAFKKFWDYEDNTFFRNQTLSIGNRSKNRCQTAILQTILNKEAGATLTVDGDYGPKTESAVLAVFNKRTVTLNDLDQKYKLTPLYLNLGSSWFNDLI